MPMEGLLSSSVRLHRCHPHQLVIPQSSRLDQLEYWNREVVLSETKLTKPASAGERQVYQSRQSCYQRANSTPHARITRYKIRKAFTCEEGNMMIAADYGQLELRLLAHITKCKSMIDAFKLGGDFHSRTAMGECTFIVTNDFRCIVLIMLQACMNM